MLPTRSILEAYRAFDANDMCNAPVWERLADRINAEYETLSRYRAFPLIELVQVDEPYADLAAMISDYRRQRLKVSELNCQHPVFSRKTNLRFRILHNIAHCVTNADFSEDGEYNVFLHQSNGLSSELKQALYTEIVIQASHKIHYGYFADQKLFLAGDI